MDKIAFVEIKIFYYAVILYHCHLILQKKNKNKNAPKT